MAVGLWLTATAANTVTLTSVQGHPGDEVEVAVALTGESAVTAIELLVPLGDMLRYVDGKLELLGSRPMRIFKKGVETYEVVAGDDLSFLL